MIVSRKNRASFFMRWNGVFLVILIGGIGCKPRQIVKPTPFMDSDPEQWVRVCLASQATSGQATVQTTWLDSELTTTFQSATTVRIRHDQGRLFLNDRALDVNQVILRPADPFVFQWNGVTYRGHLEIYGSENGFRAINRVPLESYLAGVVGAEMPAYWEPQALQVQAIASRTYCLYIKERFGSRRSWDLSTTQAHQVYRGVKAESAQVWDALQATQGQVLMTRNEQKEWVLLPAYYSSTCGGHTEASRHVFGESGIDLPGVPCAYCQDVAHLRQFYWPMAEVDKTIASERLLARYPSLQGLGVVTDVVVQEARPCQNVERVIRVQLIGSTGKTETLRGEDFRLCLDPSGRKIKSTLFELKQENNRWIFQNGQGWGHGVGLCQYGAQAQARRGKTAVEILCHYYPEAEIRCLDSN